MFAFCLCRTGYSQFKILMHYRKGKKSMHISAKTLLNIRSDIYLYGHTLLGTVNILFAQVSWILPLWLTLLLRMHKYLLILSKGLRCFFLPFFYVFPPRVYLSFRFKWNRLKIVGHLIAVYARRKSSTKSYYGQISIKYIKTKKTKHTT